MKTRFGAEAFWMMASASIRNGTIDARLVIALEAAYGSGAPADGDQISFGRIRVRVTGLPADGTYTVIHPYGKQTFNVKLDPLTAREINYTQDIGVSAPGDFSLTLQSRIGPFLRWTDPDYPYIDPVTSRAYIGNPQVLHRITGSPFNTNYFRIIGPTGVILNVGTGSNILTQTNFSLVGKIATRSGIDVKQATYSRAADGAGFVDVLATSREGQNVLLRGGVLPVRMVENAPGEYRGRIFFDGATTFLPSEITVSNITDNPDSNITRKVTDAVALRPFYSSTFRTLVLSAASRDLFIPPVLSSPGISSLYQATVVPPNMPVVNSSSGGAATEPVWSYGKQLP